MPSQRNSPGANFDVFSIIGKAFKRLFKKCSFSSLCLMTYNFCLVSITVASFVVVLLGYIWFCWSLLNCLLLLRILLLAHTFSKGINLLCVYIGCDQIIYSRLMHKGTKIFFPQGGLPKMIYWNCLFFQSGRNIKFCLLISHLLLFLIIKFKFCVPNL